LIANSSCHLDVLHTHTNAHTLVRPLLLYGLYHSAADIDYCNWRQCVV